MYVSKLRLRVKPLPWRPSSMKRAQMQNELVTQPLHTAGKSARVYVFLLCERK